MSARQEELPEGAAFDTRKSCGIRRFDFGEQGEKSLPVKRGGSPAVTHRLGKRSDGSDVVVLSQRPRDPAAISACNCHRDKAGYSQDERREKVDSVRPDKGCDGAIRVDVGSATSRDVVKWYKSAQNRAYSVE